MRETFFGRARGRRPPPRGEAGATPLEFARVCKAWARVPAGIANARARSVAAPIANREPQKSTAEGRKGGQLFSAERAGGLGNQSSSQALPGKLEQGFRR